jgi:hypothetical protein
MNSTTLAPSKTNKSDSIAQLREDLYALSPDPAVRQQLLMMVDTYFNTPKNKLFQVTHNGGGADCWANTAEFDLLKNNPQLLARKFSELIKNGSVNVSDFFTDPKPDGMKQIDGKSLGQRTGLSLAWDIGCQKMFNAPFGANDFQIERFETWIRGEQTSVVFNGKGLTDPATNVASNGSTTIDKVFENSTNVKQSVSGLRFSLEWPGAHGAPSSNSNMYHMVVTDHVGMDDKGRLGVFFYQPLNILSAEQCGPERTKVSGNLEFMPLEEFKSAVRAAWIPEHVLASLGGNRVVDPAYFTNLSQLNMAQTEKEYIDGQRPNVYPMMTADLWRERSQKYYEELSEIQKRTSRKEQ